MVADECPVKDRSKTGKQVSQGGHKKHPSTPVPLGDLQIGPTVKIFPDKVHIFWTTC